MLTYARVCAVVDRDVMSNTWSTGAAGDGGTAGANLEEPTHANTIYYIYIRYILRTLYCDAATGGAKFDKIALGESDSPLLSRALRRAC